MQAPRTVGLALGAAALCAVYVHPEALELPSRRVATCCAAQTEHPGPERLIAYRWGDGPRSTGGVSQQDGSLLTVIRGDRVYARAWVNSGPRPWPPVEGVGCLCGDHADVVFRSASGQPEHDSYHARCRFDFCKNFSAFECAFEQRARAESQRLIGGAAYGEQVALSTADPLQVSSVRDLARRSAADNAERAAIAAGKRCPVFPENAADPAIHAEVGGVVYHFCCYSCRAYFLEHHATGHE